LSIDLEIVDYAIERKRQPRKRLKKVKRKKKALKSQLRKRPRKKKKLKVVLSTLERFRWKRQLPKPQKRKQLLPKKKLNLKKRLKLRKRKKRKKLKDFQLKSEMLKVKADVFSCNVINI
jgi:hypothetical protein